jgi:RNA polymerase sigma-70 factor (ECF subfamily)
MDRPAEPGSEPSPDTLANTSDLLRLAKLGDQRALESLMARYLPRLRSWASGRLPLRARSLLDTADLVQDTLLRTIEGLDGVDVRGAGSFQAYVRSAVLNRIRDQIRWADRRSGGEDLAGSLTDPGPSPLEWAIGRDLVTRYEKGLESLTEEERQLLHLRIELDYGFDEIAALTGRPSRDAARMAVTRALRRLAEAMGPDV